MFEISVRREKNFEWSNVMLDNDRNLADYQGHFSTYAGNHTIKFVYWQTFNKSNISDIVQVSTLRYSLRHNTKKDKHSETNR
jgi:hypothetical protein